MRLHLIGHSAGSIVHSHIVDRLCALGWRFETLNLLAPAVSVDLFGRCVLPRLKAPALARLVSAASTVDGIVKGLRHPQWPHDPWEALRHLALMLSRQLAAP